MTWRSQPPFSTNESPYSTLHSMATACSEQRRRFPVDRCHVLEEGHLEQLICHLKMLDYIGLHVGCSMPVCMFKNSRSRRVPREQRKANNRCWIASKATLAEHSCLTLFWDTLVRHSCLTVSLETLPPHAFKTIFGDTLA